MKNGRRQCGGGGGGQFNQEQREMYRHGFMLPSSGSSSSSSSSVSVLRPLPKDFIFLRFKAARFLASMMWFLSSSVVRSSARMTSSVNQKRNHGEPAGFLKRRRRRHLHNSLLTRLANPVDVAIELSFKLLLPAELEKSLSVFHAFPLLGKLSAKLIKP